VLALVKSASESLTKNAHPRRPSASNPVIRSTAKKPARSPAQPYQQYRRPTTALEAVRAVLGPPPLSVLAQHRSATSQVTVNLEWKAAHRLDRILVAPRLRQALTVQYLRPFLTVRPLRVLTPPPPLISATMADSTACFASVALTSGAPIHLTLTATTRTTPQASVRMARHLVEARARHQVVVRSRVLDHRLTLPLPTTLALRRRTPRLQAPTTLVSMASAALPLQHPATPELLRRPGLVRHRLLPARTAILLTRLRMTSLPAPRGCLGFWQCLLCASLCLTALSSDNVPAWRELSRA